MPYFLLFLRRCIPAALLLILPGVAQAAVCQTEQNSLPPYLAKQEMFRDKTGAMTLEQVAAPEQDSAFVPAAGRVSTAATRDVLWLRFCLPQQQANDDYPRWLRLGPATLVDVTFYLPEKQGGYRPSRAGSSVPFSLREWPYHLFVFSVPPDDADLSRPAYLRIASSNPMPLRLDMWTANEFRDLVTLDSMFYGFYSGASLLLFGLSLAAWLWLRDRLYWVYAANLIAGAALLLLTTGFFSQFLYPDSGTVNELLIKWMTGPVLMVHVLFFVYFFDVRRNLPRIYPLLLALAGLNLASAPLNLLFDWRDIDNGLRLLGVVEAVLGLPLILYLGWKDQARRAYVPVFLPWVASGFFLSMNRLGWIEGNALIECSGEIGSLIYLVMLPALLVRRTLLAEKEKERAQHRELWEAHRMERELETRVAQRTEELARTNATLEWEMRERNVLENMLSEALDTERAAMAAQRQMVAMLSHECRTPLSIIDTAAQRMESALAEQPEQARKLDKIRRAVARMLTLLENCLAEDRLVTPGAILHKEKLDLCMFLADAYGGKSRICLVLPEAAQWVECDRQLLDVVLSNLVENALKYSGDLPITLRLLPDRLAQGWVEVEVRDQGPGVREADRGRIFEKFYRGEDNRHIPGAGLGLYLARELARNHGGDVVLVEEEFGKGAAFVLSLPVTAAPA